MGEGKQGEISIKDCACAHCLSLLMMIQINICTRGTDNGDMAFVSHLSGIWKMLAVCGEKALSPGKRCQIFFFLEATDVAMLHTG